MKLKTINQKFNSGEMDFTDPSPLQNLFIRYAIAKNLILDPIEDPSIDLDINDLREELESIKNKFKQYQELYLKLSFNEQVIEFITAKEKYKECVDKNLSEEEIYDALEHFIILAELGEMKQKNEVLHDFEYYLGRNSDKLN